MADPAPPRIHAAHGGATARLVVQYVGFQDAPGRREYVLMAQFGETIRKYTVWITREAFAKRQALLQDGPDICYQKLLRELVGTELQGSDGIAVTEDDLATYRETHSPPARKSFAPPRPPAPVKVESEAPVAGNGPVL
jgi:hypothetical protein